MARSVTPHISLDSLHRSGHGAIPFHAAWCLGMGCLCSRRLLLRRAPGLAQGTCPYVAGLSLAGHDPVGLSSEVVELLDGLLDGVGLLERAVLVVEVEGGLRVFDRVVLVLHSIRHLLAQQVPREEAEREAARARDPKKVDRVDDLWCCTLHGEAQA